MTLARLFAAAAALVACAACGSSARPSASAPAKATPAFVDAHARYEHAAHAAALVAVKRIGDQGEYWWGCSGSLVDVSRGARPPVIVTASHCVDTRMENSPIVCAFFSPDDPSRQIMPEDITELSGQPEHLCTLKLQRHKLDLAIISPQKLDPRTHPVPVAPSDVAVGDDVFGVLAPHQLVNTYFEGYVNSRLSFVDIDWDEDFKSDALLGFTSPVTGGASGGMVLNAKGELVGITLAVVNGTNTGIALRVSAFRDLL
ncbi:MAG: S1 family peptidase [Polyangiaceae bacterium]